MGHAGMTGNLTVMTQSAYAAWYAALPVQSATTSTASSGGPTAMITIPSGIGNDKSLNFQSPSITVAAGTTVTWVNQDTGSVHDVDFTSTPSGASVATSPNTNKWVNNEYSVTLTVPGTYTYICDYHDWMMGTITVTG